MLYDPSTTWNKQAWDVDNAVSVLMAENRVKNFIVVGIWNGGKTQHQTTSHKTIRKAIAS